MFKRYKDGQTNAAKIIYRFCKDAKNVTQVQEYILRNFGEME